MIFVVEKFIRFVKLLMEWHQETRENSLPELGETFDNVRSLYQYVLENYMDSKVKSSQKVEGEISNLNGLSRIRIIPYQFNFFTPVHVRKPDKAS